MRSARSGLRSATLLLALMLIACAPQRALERVIGPPPPDVWQLEARFALTLDGRAATGTLVWREDRGASDVQVTAPVSGQSFRLTRDADGATLTGLGAAPRFDASADALLAREVGWALPLDAVRGWVLGVPGPSARVERDPDGRPRISVDSDWRIEYRGWQPRTPEAPPLPLRIVATRGADEVRIAATRWTVAPR